MVKIGDNFYITSVEITKPTQKYDKPRDGYDRDTGEGKGHLFKVDAANRSSRQLPNTGQTARPSSTRPIPER
jgi:hypothetical protein